MAQFHQAIAAGQVPEEQPPLPGLEAMNLLDLPQPQEQRPVEAQELEAAAEAGVEAEQLLVRLLEPLILAVPAEVVQLVGPTPEGLLATSWEQYPRQVRPRLNRLLAD